MSMHNTMCHVLCHGSQTTVRRYLGLDNPTSRDVTAGARHKLVEYFDTKVNKTPSKTPLTFTSGKAE
jgi:hypothetical protein